MEWKMFLIYLDIACFNSYTYIKPIRESSVITNIDQRHEPTHDVSDIAHLIAMARSKSDSCRVM